MMHKKSLAVLSTSALAAGMAHGGVLYNYVNKTIVAGGDQNLTFDLNQDGSPDFVIEFDNNNANKPYISDSVGLSGSTESYVLSDPTDDNGNSSQGLPLTTNGTVINADYETAQENGYFNQDDNNNTIGGWTNSGSVDGYVGLELIDAQGYTHYGWAQFIYNSTNVIDGVTGTLTLVDYAMETTTNAIDAGQTAEVGSPPAVFLGPTNQNVAAGGTAQLMVVATGDPAPTYQWVAGAVGSGAYTNLTDGGSFSGVTNNILTISNLTTANEADYTVILSNTNGTITNAPPATLTVYPLVINSLTPSPIELFTGGSVSITASYSSAAPITSYQWQRNQQNLTDGGSVSGSTTSTLVLTDVSPANAGNYDVILANTYGAVTSQVTSLTVTAPPTPYQQYVVSLGPVVYYSFNEASNPASNNAIAFDSMSGLNGTYGDLVTNGSSGIEGPDPADGFDGFAATNSAIAVGPTSHNADSWVVVPPLNIDTNTVTFVTWVDPQTTEGDWNVLISYRGPASGTAEELNYNGNADLSYHWNDQGYSYNWDPGSAFVPPVDQWSLIALVVAPTNTVLYLINSFGIETATNDTATDANFPSTGQPPQVFNNPGSIGGDSVDGNFVGYMDEVAMFNQSLTYTQVSNLYNVAVTGVIPPAPPIPVTLYIQASGGNVILTWSQGTLVQAPSITGPWTTNSAATSPYTTSATGTQMYYEIQ